jgi:hypothetical protein
MYSKSTLSNRAKDVVKQEVRKSAPPALAPQEEVKPPPVAAIAPKVAAVEVPERKEQ